MAFTFLKYPKSALSANLTHAENSVLLQLLRCHYTLRKNDYELPFYCSDREISELSKTSRSTVWKAKKKLSKLNIIEFFSGRGNKTYYRIMPENQLDLFKK